MDTIACVAQTTNIAPNLRAIYRRYLGFLWLNKVVHSVLDTAINLIARTQGFSFPTKFNWEWKLEMLLGKYEQGTSDLFKKIIKPGMTVIDIGAQIGYYTRLFARLVGPAGHVYAFEADRDNFLLLQKNTLGFRNVHAYNVAISDTEGYLDFYVVEGSTGCHSLLPSKDPSHTVQVPSTTIDAFVKQEKIKVDAIKMDIEGAEPMAVAGMRQMFSVNTPISIVTELNPEALSAGNTEPSDFITMVERSGFRTFQILQGGKLKQISAGDLRKIEFTHAKNDYINILFKR